MFQMCQRFPADVIKFAYGFFQRSSIGEWNSVITGDSSYTRGLRLCAATPY